MLIAINVLAVILQDCMCCAMIKTNARQVQTVCNPLDWLIPSPMISQAKDA